MRFSVSHLTHYRYSAPVTLGPHLLRLSPQAQRFTERRLIIAPAPSAQEERRDAYGNRVTEIAFEGPTTYLRVESRFTLETAVPPPAPSAAPAALPWSLQEAALAPYLPPEAPHESVRAFAEALAAETRGDALGFLGRLNAALYARTDRRIRLEGGAHSPERTLESRTGACRDLAVLFMACCRSLGVPARFVSGYQARAETPDGRRHLHAWPEVYLPGAGWRGFDPTHGLPVLDGHIALCAAPTQGETMPLEGGFMSEGPVSSTLDYSVRIETG